MENVDYYLIRKTGVGNPNYTSSIGTIYPFKPNGTTPVNYTVKNDLNPGRVRFQKVRKIHIPLYKELNSVYIETEVYRFDWGDRENWARWLYTLYCIACYNWILSDILCKRDYRISEWKRLKELEEPVRSAHQI